MARGVCEVIKIIGILNKCYIKLIVITASIKTRGKDGYRCQENTRNGRNFKLFENTHNIYWVNRIMLKPHMEYKKHAVCSNRIKSCVTKTIRKEINTICVHR